MPQNLLLKYLEPLASVKQISYNNNHRSVGESYNIKDNMDKDDSLTLNDTNDDNNMNTSEFDSNIIEL